MEPEAEPLMPETITPHPPPPSHHHHPTTTKPTTKIPWIPLAAASGACAAFNGVFAKLYVVYLFPQFQFGGKEKKRKEKGKEGEEGKGERERC